MPDLSRMTTVYVALLKRGPRAAEWDARPDELERLQEAHLANIRAMAEAGTLIATGPFTDDGFWRGMFVFRAESVEAVRALVESDPSVQAGRLDFEIHPWMVERGTFRGAE